MEPQTFTPASQPKFKLNLKLLLVAGAVLVFVLILVAWLLRVNYPSYTITETPLHADRNFSHLQGSDIYGYNGLAFYKVNLAKNNEITTLASGLKLPKPSSITWAGSEGALMTFSGSFIYTDIERALTSRGLTVDESTQDYTWYLNFADSSLSLVSELSILPGAAMYSAQDKGFYYVQDATNIESDSFAAAKTPLHFYSLETKQDRTVSDDLGVVDITSMKSCPNNSPKVCFIARDATDNSLVKLTGITQEGKASTLLESKAGRIFASNSPSLYLSIKPASESDFSTSFTNQEEREEDVDFPPMPPELHDLTAKTTTTLPFEVAGESIFPYFTTAKDFYVISTKMAADGKGNTYVSGAQSTVGTTSASEFELLFPDDKRYNAGVRDVAGYGDGDNKTSLITTNGGTQLLFSPSDQVKTLPALSQKDIQAVVDACKTGDTVDYLEDEKLFKVYFTDNDQFTSKITSFSQCLVQRDKRALIGYNFYFGARDAVNGRIVTD